MKIFFLCIYQQYNYAFVSMCEYHRTLILFLYTLLCWLLGLKLLVMIKCLSFGWEMLVFFYRRPTQNVKMAYVRNISTSIFVFSIKVRSKPIDCKTGLLINRQLY